MQIFPSGTFGDQNTFLVSTIYYFIRNIRRELVDHSSRTGWHTSRRKSSRKTSKMIFRTGMRSRDKSCISSPAVRPYPSSLFRRRALTCLDVVPPPDDQQPPKSPAGSVPQPFSYPFSKMAPTQYSGGTAKIADSTVFGVSTQVAVAEVEVYPGGMRELHWHPSEDEWGLIM